MNEWQPLGENVFRYEDTCQVYALRDGARALLIDLGSGAALAALDQLGIEQAEAVLFTHAHREQCQGASLAEARGLALRFPEGARATIDPALRADFRRLAPGHLAYPTRFHPPQPIPSARFDLLAGQRFAFGPFDIQVIAAPGHADHQVAFLVEQGAESWLFCGDALAGRGKVHEPYCLETDHYTGAGARLAADTLCALRNLRPAWVCPSHGEPFDEAVWDAFEITISRLRELADLKDTMVPRRPAVQRLARPTADAFVRLSEHLWMWQNSYFLVSEDGPVLMVDVQCQLPDSFFELYCATLGDRPIEAVFVTHLHCDHVMGVEDLRRRQPLTCYAHECLVGPIENPYAYARPWLHNHPTHVDVPLAEGQTVRWHEYSLTAWWFPGQTDLHAVYATVIDGHRALFAGDNFYPPQQWGGTGGLCGYNGGHPALWRRSAELVMRLEPDWVLASHMQPFPYRRADFEAVVEWSDRVAGLMRDLAPDGNLERHHSPHFLEARPYVQPAAGELTVTLRCVNTYPHTLGLEVTPRLPAGVGGEADTRRLALAPGEAGETTWRWVAEADVAGMRMVTFDVTANGRRWGEIVECYLRGAGSYEGM